MGVDPSRCTVYTLEVFTWKMSSTSGCRRLSESMSEVVSLVMALMRRMTLVQSPLQRFDWRCISLRKSCWRCMRVKSPSWS